MSDYLVTDTELTSVANAIRTKGETSASLSFPTGFVNAINDISSGDTILTLLATAEYTANTTTTYDTPIGTITFPAITKDTMLFVRVYDKAGPRTGYFYGSNSIIVRTSDSSGVSTNQTGRCTQYVDRNGALQVDYSVNNGVYCSYQAGDKIKISTRYKSSVGTINGTYHVDVYLMTLPNLAWGKD